tara:strand:- start:2451 stop:3578 length:1128 start_codon:yes stop_codon:yes gene_type:complete
LGQFQNAELFGLPHSYYTLIARAYLRKQTFAVKEVSSRRADFVSEIVPAIGRGIIPVLRLEDGRLIQDSLDIIEAGETNGATLSAMPTGAKQELISRIFFLYGSQALLKAAMHYRWTFYDDQKAFLDHAFGLTAGDEGSARIMDKMKSYLPILGVSADTIPEIEHSFETLLKLLDTHFATYPYLLGGQPCLGDYGMLGPLCAHLGRDPVPETIIKRLAPNVFRWTERMNCATADMPEYDGAEAFLTDDLIPETLLAVLSFIVEEYGPELADRIAFIREHQQETDLADGMPVGAKPSQRAIGIAPVRYRGVTTDVAVQPYLLYCQRRVQSAFQTLGEQDRNWAEERLFSGEFRCVIAPELAFTVGRKNNIEVWEKL